MPLMFILQGAKPFVEGSSKQALFKIAFIQKIAFSHLHILQTVWRGSCSSPIGSSPLPLALALPDGNDGANAVSAAPERVHIVAVRGAAAGGSFCPHQTFLSPLGLPAVRDKTQDVPGPLPQDLAKGRCSGLGWGRREAAGNSPPSLQGSSLSLCFDLLLFALATVLPLEATLSAAPGLKQPSAPTLPQRIPSCPRHCRQEWHSPGWRQPLPGGTTTAVTSCPIRHPHQQTHRSSALLRHRSKRCSASALSPQGRTEPRG